MIQKQIEAKMRRMLGQSPAATEAMHAFNETQVWSCRCWNCRTINTAVRSELKTCAHCGKNLWSRSE